MTSGSPQERAQQTAGTAAEEGRFVARSAKAEAQNVASEAKYQARSVINDAMSQVNSQSRDQKDRLAGTLRTLGDDLESMATNGSGMAADLARQASDYARSFGSKLESREPTELLDEVRSFARNRPGVFLLGALAAGVAVGRLARGAADGIAAAEAQQSIGTSGTTGAGFTGTYPAAGPTGTMGVSTTGTATGTGTGYEAETTTSTYAGQRPTYTPTPGAEPTTSHGQPTGIPPAPANPAPAGYDTGATAEDELSVLKDDDTYGAHRRGDEEIR